MSEPLLITASLCSPLAGDAPMLDAILERYAFIHNINNCESLSKGAQLNTHDTLKYYMIESVPLAVHTFKNGKRCYCVSFPIVDYKKDETEHFSTRMDFNTLKNIVSEKDINKLRQNTGAYAPTFEPFRVRAASQIKWYANGTKSYLSKWLNSIKYIGSRTSSGFGRVSQWSVEACDHDFWMMASCKDKKPVLMRSIPKDEMNIDEIDGAMLYFGALVPPYWHPQRQMEILKPC